MLSLKRLIFLLLVIAAVTYVVTTSAGLPPSVAARFGHQGLWIGRMDKDIHVALMAGLAGGLPLLLYGSVGVLPRLFTRFINIPNRDFWLAPERREKMLGDLEHHGMILGIFSMVFICAMQALIVAANQRTPARIDINLVWVLLGFFIAGIIGMAVTMWRRFRRPS